MTANISGRLLQILIGSDQQDWSEHRASLVVGFTPIEDEGDPGKLTITGILEIQPNVGIPESIDPFANPTRWRKGQDIIARPRNDADDAYIDCPWSWLKILKTPARPRTNANLVLEVGCKLEYSDGYQLDGDESGVIYGVAESSNVVADRLLQASSIDASNISLATWPYSLSRPLGKQQANYLSQAAALAYANDWRILHQGGDGNITQTQLEFSTSSPVATVTRSLDDILYEPNQGVFEVPDLTTVAGVGYDVTAATSPVVSIEDSVVDDFSQISPGSFGSGIAERTITTTEFSNDANPFFSERVQVYQAEAIAFQNPSVPSQLVEISDSTNAQYYETGKTDPRTARLLQQIQTSLVRGQTLDPADEFANMRETYRSKLDITYSDTEPMATYKATEMQAEIELDESSPNPWNQRVTLDEDYQWTEYATGYWDRTDKVGRPLIADRSNLNRELQNPWAIITKVTKHPRDTPNRPFTTQFFTPVYSESEIHYEGTATYIPDGGPTGLNQDALFVVPDGMAFSEDQLNGLAKKHRDLLVGMNRQYQIRLAVNDALLQSPPLAEIDVVTTDGTFTYLADALTFEFGPNETVAECNGIWVGGGYTPVVNLAADIPVGVFEFDVAQVSASLAATIPVGSFEFNVSPDASLAATIPVGEFAFVIAESGGGGSGATWQTAALSEWQTLTLSEWQTLPLS